MTCMHCIHVLNTVDAIITCVIIVAYMCASYVFVQGRPTTMQMDMKNEVPPTIGCSLYFKPLAKSTSRAASAEADGRVT